MAVPGPCSEIVTHASSRTSDALASAPRSVRVVAKRDIKAALIDLCQNPEPEPRPREADIAGAAVGEEADRFQIRHCVLPWAMPDGIA